MNPRRHSSVRRLLTLFTALAVLLPLASLIPLALLDWQWVRSSHEHEATAGYQFARALVQERLATVRLLAKEAASRAGPVAGEANEVTIIALSMDGQTITSSSGRLLPRLPRLVDRLKEAPASGVEVDDRGYLVAAGTCAAGDRIYVAVLPFTDEDAQAIKKATGLESSFFAGEARTITTLLDRNGQPVTAPLNEPWESLALQAGHPRLIYDRGGASPLYLEIRAPLSGLDGSPVGAYAISLARPGLWLEFGQWLLPWLAAFAVSTLLLFALATWLKRRFLQPLETLQSNLASMVEGRSQGGPLAVDCPLVELDGLFRYVNQLSVTRADLAYSNERLNERLIRTQNLAALGQLVVGVAHDLNNPLTTIMGLVDMLQASDLDPDTCRDLVVIHRQAERSSKIVRNLLTFARRQKAEPQWVSLNDLIYQTLELLAYQARVGNIRCEPDLDRDLPLTWADPSQMQQVFFNLISNAMQAMTTTHGRGVLKVESIWSPPAPGAPHGQIIIRVQDDGPGIPAEVLSRVFQPYFTTKEMNGGSGLGLSIADGIIKRHNGRIWADNNLHGGACFSIQLPVTPEPQQTMLPAPSNGAGPQRILLSDSDAARLGLVTQVLRKRGYFVMAAGDGLLARTRLDRDVFDLVVCGLELARLNGQELLSWARANRPEMAERFVFLAAESISSEAEAFLQAAQAPVLRPPYQEDTILAVVGQMLEPEATSDASQE